MSLPGLQNYRHDSEISDSDGESSPSHIPLLTSGIVSSGLGIPTGQSNSKAPITPPTFIPPSVDSAPFISLVGYDNEEDDGAILDTSLVANVEVVHQPLPSSLMMLVDRHDPVPSIKEDARIDSSFPDHNREPVFFCLREVELPPEAFGTCSLSLQDKIRTHLRKKRQLGVSPYDVIVKGKSFRNPSIYEKLIQLCGIDEFGTNFDERMFDPKQWQKDEFYERLADAQKKVHENKMKSRGKIEFKSGTKLSPAATVKPGEASSGRPSGLLPIPNMSAAQDSSKKRKSKWDNPSLEQKNSRGSSPMTNSSGAVVGAQALVNARLIDKNLMKLFKS